MTKVVNLGPKQQLENVAHQLRRLASAAEMDPPMMVVVIEIHEDPEARPCVYSFGKEQDRLKTVGALHDAAARLLRREG